MNSISSCNSAARFLQSYLYVEDDVQSDNPYCSTSLIYMPYMLLDHFLLHPPPLFCHNWRKLMIYQLLSTLVCFASANVVVRCVGWFG